MQPNQRNGVAPASTVATPRSLKSLFLRYLVAVIAVLFAFLIREALERQYGELPHYITFYPVVLVVAMLADFWAGVLATAVSALVAFYWIIPPRGQFTIVRTSDAIGLAIFCAMGVGISVVAALYHRNRQRVAAYEKNEAIWEERRKAEEVTKRLLSAVQQERDRLSALVNSVNDEIWFADTEKEFTLANPAALREFGFDAANRIDVENLAQNLEVYRPDGNPRPIEEAPPLRALRGEVVKDEEEIVRTPRQASCGIVRSAQPL